MIYIVFIIFTLMILLIALYQWQYFMVFTPTYYREKENVCDRCEFLSITTSDGIELEGVVYEPKHATHTLLFFGGRSHDSVGLVSKLCVCYPDVRIITFNYRSYGKSQGVANEANLLADALLVAQRVEKHYGSFYVMGFSLGSALASYVAQHHRNTLGVFLLGAFDSIDALVSHKYTKLLKYFSRYHFTTASFLQHATAKVYLFVSQNDEIIPLENARHLRKSIANLAYYKEFEGLSHKELLCNPEIINTIQKVLHEKNPL